MKQRFEVLQVALELVSAMRSVLERGLKRSDPMRRFKIAMSQLRAAPQPRA